LLGAIQYETAPDGTLHISIPPQPTGLAGRNRTFWLVVFLEPPLFIIVAWSVYHDLQTLERAAVAAIVIAIFSGALGWLIDNRFRRQIWIEATPAQLTIRNQRGRSIS